MNRTRLVAKLPSLLAIGGLSAGLCGVLYVCRVPICMDSGRPESLLTAGKLEPVGRALMTSSSQLTDAMSRRGVYMAGSNKYGIVNPSVAGDSLSKNGNWPDCFRHKVFRDLALAERHAAAIDSEGNLVQWGALVCSGLHTPQTTVKGRDLVQVRCTSDAVFAVTRSGDLLAVPLDGTLAAKSVDLSAKVDAIAAGDNHVLAKSSDGFLYALASNRRGNQYGQMGRGYPEEDTVPFNPCKVSGLENQAVSHIACGREHSLALTRDNRCYGFGQNVYGQLAQAFTTTTSSEMIVRPTEILQLDASVPITDIYAGGSVSMFLQRSKVDGYKLYSCGNGINGMLGSGGFSHVSPKLSLVNSLSNNLQYNEASSALEPIKVGQLSIGASHVAAVLCTSDAELRFGNDLYVWGNNQFGQLFTGNSKSGNHSSPFVPLPLNSGKPEIADRFMLVPSKPLPEAPNVKVEQAVVCGFNNSAIYFRVTENNRSIWQRLFGRSQDRL